MKHYFLSACLIALFSIRLPAQTHVKESEIDKYIGKTVELLGNAYYFKSVNKDFAIIKLGSSKNSARLVVYYKFKNASALATLTNNEFGHFSGTVALIEGMPALIVNKLHDANFYAPKDEGVDSALYYRKRGKLQFVFLS